MENVLLLGLSAPTDDDPYGDPLLRALSAPGASGTRLVVSTAPSVLARAGSGIVAPSHPVADALRQMASLADGIVLTAPESDAAPPDSLRTLINWLTWPAEGSPLAGKPVAVITTSTAPAAEPDAYCEAERMLFTAGATIIGPRTVVPRVDRALREEPDGQATFSDPGAAVRLLFHIHRTAAAAREHSGLPPADDFKPWLL
ncbi:NAD(P)H-dependent oxidoreductase [Streptomyces sp. NPDC008001]|uniref:NAD(P)H-dependent oxidoreductase n=1 Tax=Streptomyces sp. NPDC008001 TaxID=3364804 RepID=UPI0036EA01F3